MSTGTVVIQVLQGLLQGASAQKTNDVDVKGRPGEWGNMTGAKRKSQVTVVCATAGDREQNQQSRRAGESVQSVVRWSYQHEDPS